MPAEVSSTSIARETAAGTELAGERHDRLGELPPTQGRFGSGEHDQIALATVDGRHRHLGPFERFDHTFPQLMHRSLIPEVEQRVGVEPDER